MQVNFCTVLKNTVTKAIVESYSSSDPEHGDMKCLSLSTAKQGSRFTASSNSIYCNMKRTKRARKSFSSCILFCGWLDVSL